MRTDINNCIFIHKSHIINSDESLIMHLIYGYFFVKIKTAMSLKSVKAVYAAPINYSLTFLSLYRR